MTHEMNEKDQGLQIKNNIIQIFQNLGIDHHLTTHEPVFTMEEATRVSGHSPEQGVKTLLAKVYKGSESNFILLVSCGEERMDFETLKKVLEVKKIRLASTQEVIDTLGIQIGSLTPLGYPEQRTVVFDKKILSNKSVFINPGINTQTLEVGSVDLLTAVRKWSENVIEL